MRIDQEALTFDDVLLVPAYSDVLPRDVDLSTQLTRSIRLNLPAVSAAMDTVTEARLAITIAQEGGIGIVHKSMTAEAQAREVLRVKKYESGVISDPITVSPERTIREVIDLTRAKGISGVPVVADGGELIIYAPHIRQFSEVHGAIIAQIGYHVRDYFVKQWDRFKDLPWGVLAHSTHLRGVGEFDAVTGVERPRIQVTLATGIPEAECRAVNLGYRDPATINPQEWAGREAEGVLLVPHAGEILYRLKQA
jgi:CBS domain-containing protein